MLTRYRIWQGFTRGEFVLWEKSDEVRRAKSPQEALEQDRGYSNDPTFRIVALPDTHYHADMHGECTAFSVKPCSKCAGPCCSECSHRGRCEFCF